MKTLLFCTGTVLVVLFWAPLGTCEVASRVEILEVARQVMASARYCALVTLDQAGSPQVRAMDPFPPDGDMTVRLGTNSSTRKVDQIRHSPRVALYYFDPEGGSYVTLSGVARLINDADEKSEWWKEEWTPFYEDCFRGDDYLLIEVTPKRCEVMSLEYKIAASPKAWQPAVVLFP
jgi:general stress protein 26